ncbi:hypothetical protein Asp14428_65550 [Actinoplanes sp. NBRC 14428]|nr:hypothetical protein Asp14428_65550 [Actinoplanes sp. NBRC 14428]
MILDLSGYNLPEHTGCLTERQVADHAAVWLLANLANNRKLAAHLLQTANDLMVTAQTLMQIFLHDGYDPSCKTNPGLTEAQRLQVLTLASTCAYNATRFIQEAQRRRIRRPATGWDPITNPVTT